MNLFLHSDLSGACAYEGITAIEKRNPAKKLEVLCLSDRVSQATADFLVRAYPGRVFGPYSLDVIRTPDFDTYSLLYGFDDHVQGGVDFERFRSSAGLQRAPYTVLPNVVADLGVRMFNLHTQRWDWNHASASQISTYLGDHKVAPGADVSSTGSGCKRRWLYEKIEGWRTPDQPHHVLGRDTHAHLENFIESGATPPNHEPAAELARALFPLVPHGPVPGVDVEHHFIRKMALAGKLPVILNGFTDVRMRPGCDPYVPPEDNGIHLAAVEDHKTGSNRNDRNTTSGYGLNALDLTRDWQMSIYGYDTFETFPSVHGVRLCHNNVNTRGAKKPHKIQAWISRAAIYSGWLENLLAVLSEMREVATYTEDQVPRNPKACPAYGGCKLKEHCWRNGAPVSNPYEGF